MTQKKCKWCGKIRPLDGGFYRHSEMADGHLNKCVDCIKSAVRKHRAENDSVREYDRERYYANAERRARTRATTDAWRKKNHQKSLAQGRVAHAVRSGKLVRLPCEVCGDSRSHGHHDDYSKPLDVRWLCAKHHAEHHAKDKMK